MIPTIDLFSESMAAADAGSSSVSASASNQTSHPMKRGYRRPSLNSSYPNKRPTNSSLAAPELSCRRSSTMAVIDVAVLLAVFFACGYLALPYIQLLYSCLVTAFDSRIGDGDGTMAVKLLGAGLGLLGIIAYIVLSTRFAASSSKCDRPNCLGLRDAPEFDVKIETEEETIQNTAMGSASSRSQSSDDGFFELSGDRHRELEAELKKVAPVNGRVVLVFRARCGCSAGKMIVMGPKKAPRKIKK